MFWERGWSSARLFVGSGSGWITGGITTCEQISSEQLLGGCTISWGVSKDAGVCCFGCPLVDCVEFTSTNPIPETNCKGLHCNVEFLLPAAEATLSILNLCSCFAWGVPTVVGLVFPPTQTPDATLLSEFSGGGSSISGTSSSSPICWCSPVRVLKQLEELPLRPRWWLTATIVSEFCGLHSSISLLHTATISGPELLVSSQTNGAQCILKRLKSLAVLLRVWLLVVIEIGSFSIVVLLASSVSENVILNAESWLTVIFGRLCKSNLVLLVGSRVGP